MNKVTEFLEKYVQWVAVGLGAFWIGLMAWMFWTGPKASVTVAGTVYTPGELDKAMVTGPGPVETLGKALKSTAPSIFAKRPGEGSPSTQPSFIADYLAGLMGRPPEFIPSMTPGVDGGGPAVVDATATNNAAVKGTLPVVDGKAMLIPVTGVDAAGKPVNAVAERSVVQIPDPAQLVNPMAPVAAAGEVAAVPGAVAPAPAIPLAPNPPTEVELSWVTGSFTVKMDALGKAFAAAQLPAGASATAFLSVEVVREEQDSGGKWSKPVTVKPLANHIVPPMPPAADLIEALRYREWAVKAQSEIVHPPFYVVTAGAPWRSITMPADVAGAAPPPDAAQPFDPANPPTDRPLTTEEKGKVYQYKEKLRQEAARQKAAENRAKTPTPITPTNAPLIPEAEPIGSTHTPILLAQARPGGGGIIGERPVTGGDRGGRRPVTPPPALPGGVLGERPFAPPAAPGAPAQPVAITEGLFNPAATPDVEVYFHDDSVEPGKTYQYKVRVHLLNPLFATKNMAANAKDADVFDLVLENVSGPVTVPPKYYFFLAAGPNILNNKANVKVDYYFWSKGFWQYKSLVVQAGDAVGETSWTVADLRKDPRGDQHDHVLFVNGQEGTLVSRNLGLDLKDPDNKRIKSLAQPAGVQPAASAGLPAAPGAIR